MRTKKAMLLGVIFLLMVLLGACAAPRFRHTKKYTSSPAATIQPAIMPPMSHQLIGGWIRILIVKPLNKRAIQ